MVYFCLWLTGCSKHKEDSDRVVVCKTVVESVAFNASDMVYVDVDETTGTDGDAWVEIQFDDFNKYGAKQRRRVTCDFGENQIMTDVTVDGETMIPELVRNLGLEGLIRSMKRFSEKIKNG
jgi:hypothetical protein